MTLPDVDRELERLLSLTREATRPPPAARARIRAGLDARLAAGPDAARARATSKAWFGFTAGVIGLGVVGLWLFSAPRTPARGLSATTAGVAVSSSLPLARASAPLASADVVSTQPAPPLEATVSLEPAARSQPPASRLRGPSGAKSEPAEELTLVRAMQAALRAGDASRALALAAEHAQRFPKGTLVEEREGARAIANCQRAEPAARPPILAAFMQGFGASPYAARVKAACQ